MYDHYRWLEELSNESVQNFIDKQNNVTVDYLKEVEGLNVLHDKIYDVFIDTYTRFETFERRGSKDFIYTKDCYYDEYANDSNSESFIII